MTTYEQVIEFLFNQYPIYQSIGLDAYKPDLSNITSICKIIGNPEKKIKTIHVDANKVLIFCFKQIIEINLINYLAKIVRVR